MLRPSPATSGWGRGALPRSRSAARAIAIRPVSSLQRRPDLLSHRAGAQGRTPCRWSDLRASRPGGRNIDVAALPDLCFCQVEDDRAILNAIDRGAGHEPVTRRDPSLTHCRRIVGAVGDSPDEPPIARVDTRTPGDFFFRISLA